MTDAFDPYYKWLGIPPDEQPPDHYRLLGLKRYESDGDVISNAADQRMILLRTFQTGKHGSDSQRLLNEVAKARLALLTPESKTEYDDELRREEQAKRREREAARAALKASRSGPLATKTAASRGTTGPAVKPQTAPAPEIELDSKDDSIATFIEAEPSVLSALNAAQHAPAQAQKPLSKRKAEHEAKKRLVGIVVGGILGLGIGYSLLCNLQPGADFLGLFPRQAEQATGADTAALPSGNASEEKPKPRPKPRDNAKKPKTKPKQGGHDTQIKVVPTPLPKSNGDTDVEPTDPFAGFETAAELKPVADTSATPVAKFDVAQQVKLDELTLSDAAATLAAGQKLRLDPVAGQQARWQAVLSGDPEVTVAQFWVDGPVLRGQWMSEAAQSPAAQQLRNCTLAIRIGEAKRTLALRKSLKIDPLTLDMSKQINIQKIATEHEALAALPPVERLFVEVQRVEFPVPAQMKRERRQAPFKASKDESLAIVFDLEDATEEKPEIRIKAGQVKDAWELRAESAVDGKEFARDSVRAKEFDMTFAALKTRKRQTEVRLKNVEKDWKAISAEKDMLEDGIKKLSSRRTPQDIVRLNQARARLAVVEKAYNSKDAELEHIKTSLASIAVEEELSAKLHKAAKIYFRVFVRSGDVEIDLVRADDSKPEENAESEVTTEATSSFESSTRDDLGSRIDDLGFDSQRRRSSIRNPKS
ncbi:MAG: hypothetical protein WD468_11180 [Pirellulales bacterium]